MQVVIFTLGEERYAVPIERVQEVIRHAALRPVGSPIGCVAGVIDRRGQIVPVCDVAARVGARASRATRRRIVIVDLTGGCAGVLVDAVDQVVSVPADRLAAVPAAVAAELVLAIAQLGEELVLVLDVDRVLAGVVEPPAEPLDADRVREHLVEPLDADRPLADVVKPPPAPEPAAKTPRARKPAARRSAAQPSRKRPAKATRSTGGAATASPSSVTA